MADQICNNQWCPICCEPKGEAHAPGCAMECPGCKQRVGEGHGPGCTPEKIEAVYTKPLARWIKWREAVSKSSI